VQRHPALGLVRQDFRTLFLALLAALVVGVAVALGLITAYGDGSLAAVWFWPLSCGAIALVILGVAVWDVLLPARVGRGLAVAAVVFATEALPEVELFYEGFGVPYTAALALGAVAVLPAEPPRVLWRGAVAAAAVALCAMLDRTVGDGSFGFAAPAAAVFAVGLAEAVADIAQRGRYLLALGVLALPGVSLGAGVLVADWKRDRAVSAAQEAAKPPPARVGVERVVWTFPADRFESGPLVAEDLVLADTRTAVVALEARTGRVRWRAPLPGRDGLTRPLVHDGLLLYPANRAGLHALELDDGSRRWRFEAEETSMMDVEPAGGLLLVSGVGPRGVVLYGLSPGDGAVRWRSESPGDGLELHRVGGRVVVEVLGLWRPIDPVSGKLGEPVPAPVAPYGYGRYRALRSTERGWKYRPDWESWTSEPVQADGVVYVSVLLDETERNGGLDAVDARTGERRWRVEIAGDAEHRPAVWRDLVFATSTEACAVAGGCRTALYAIRR
jgi:outer membrane protein assembly factor BamB